MTMDIVSPPVNKYLEGLLHQRDPWLAEMEAEAEERDFPAIGPLVGTMLELLARSVGAKRIMELGSGFGYSGLWFARALPEDGYILLSDFKEENRQKAEKYFDMAGKRHLMEFKTGDAMTLLGEDKGPYDIIFCDLDKLFYPKVIEPVFGLLRTGGLFITDNTLWSGRVAKDPPDESDETTAAVKNLTAV
ncbi:MAG: methyltransferase domain-containing protein [bacterium]|nr:methyltransferase domain-containing protein [bacterium]